MKCMIRWLEKAKMGEVRLAVNITDTQCNHLNRLQTIAFNGAIVSRQRAEICSDDWHGT